MKSPETCCRSANIARIVTWLAGGMIALIVVLVPLGYYHVGAGYIKGMLAGEAENLAEAVSERIVAADPWAWEGQAARLAPYLARRPSGGEAEIRRVINLAGETVAESADPLRPPLRHARHPLQDAAGINVGYLEVSRSLHPLLLQTLALAVLMLALGAGLFVLLEVLPLRALYRAQAEIQQLASTDYLTHTYNRRMFSDLIHHEIQRAERYHKPLSLILLDVDHFKAVNDTYGHGDGDVVLVQMVDIVRTHIRKVDFLGRWGGEEFILLAPETPLQGACELAEKLRAQVAETVFPKVGRLTISLGVTEYQRGEGMHSLIRHADEALYQAKQNGRNRVEAKAATQ